MTTTTFCRTRGASAVLARGVATAAAVVSEAAAAAAGEGG